MLEWSLWMVANTVALEALTGKKRGAREQGL